LSQNPSGIFSFFFRARRQNIWVEPSELDFWKKIVLNRLKVILGKKFSGFFQFVFPDRMSPRPKI